MNRQPWYARPVCLLALLCCAAAPAQDLLRLSEQADQLDKLDFDGALERADSCTRARKFSCSESELAKAAKLAANGKARTALAGSRARLANERAALATEIRLAEQARLAELRRQERERLAELAREREEREQEERRERRAAAEARAEREADEAESTQSSSAGVTAQVLSHVAQNAAFLNKMQRDTNAAIALANRVRADQAAQRERENAERADRAAQQRRDAASERAQRQQADSARLAESQRAEQRRAREADAARELAAEQARGRELERQRLAADQLEKQERARKAAEERNQEAREKSARLAAEDREKRVFRDAMIRGIRLVATKCPDGEGHYYATGLLPKPKPKGGYCIDVHYEASCPGSRNVVTGVATNFIGLNGCFGDTYKIDPKPACDVKAVAIRVTDVTLGCN